MDPSLPWTVASSIATIVGSAAAVAAAVVAIVTLSAVKRDSTDRSRPVVTAHLELHPFADFEASLVIRNSGASVARQVTVTFEPAKLVLDDGRNAEIANVLTSRYKDVIPVLASGAQLKNLYFRRDWNHKGSVRNAHPLPDRADVHISYKDSEERRTYTEVFPISVDLLMHESHTRPGSTNDVQRRIAKAAEAIARGIGSA